MTTNRTGELPCTVLVEREKETHYMVRFRERLGEDEQPRLGTVYVSKVIAGDAKKLRIIIDDGGE